MEGDGDLRIISTEKTVTTIVQKERGVWFTFSFDRKHSSYHVEQNLREYVKLCVEYFQLFHGSVRHPRSGGTSLSPHTTLEASSGGLESLMLRKAICQDFLSRFMQMTTPPGNDWSRFDKFSGSSFTQPIDLSSRIPVEIPAFLWYRMEAIMSSAITNGPRSNGALSYIKGWVILHTHFPVSEKQSSSSSSSLNTSSANSKSSTTPSNIPPEYQFGVIASHPWTSNDSENQDNQQQQKSLKSLLNYLCLSSSGIPNSLKVLCPGPNVVSDTSTLRNDKLGVLSPLFRTLPPSLGPWLYGSIIDTQKTPNVPLDVKLPLVSTTLSPLIHVGDEAVGRLIVVKAQNLVVAVVVDHLKATPLVQSMDDLYADNMKNESANGNELGDTTNALFKLALEGGGDGSRRESAPDILNECADDEINLMLELAEKNQEVKDNKNYHPETKNEKNDSSKNKMKDSQSSPSRQSSNSVTQEEYHSSDALEEAEESSMHERILLVQEALLDFISDPVFLEVADCLNVCRSDFISSFSKGALFSSFDKITNSRSFNHRLLSSPPCPVKIKENIAVGMADCRGLSSNISAGGRLAGAFRVLVGTGSLGGNYVGPNSSAEIARGVLGAILDEVSECEGEGDDEIEEIFTDSKDGSWLVFANGHTKKYAATLMGGINMDVTSAESELLFFFEIMFFRNARYIRASYVWELCDVIIINFYLTIWTSG